MGRDVLDIINKSLVSGVVLSFFKHAVMQPLLKKPNLDPDSPSNFRPISKLPFLSKILEKAVFNQLQSYLAENSILDMYQSGFRGLSLHS